MLVHLIFELCQCVCVHMCMPACDGCTIETAFPDANSSCYYNVFDFMITISCFRTVRMFLRCLFQGSDDDCWLRAYFEWNANLFLTYYHVLCDILKYSLCFRFSLLICMLLLYGLRFMWDSVILFIWCITSEQTVTN